MVAQGSGASQAPSQAQRAALAWVSEAPKGAKALRHESVEASIPANAPTLPVAETAIREAPI